MTSHINRKYQKKYPIAEINVVPYIDVMLVLLIIFMITAPLLNQGIHVELPQVSANTLTIQQQEPLVISIDHKGRYYLNISSAPSKAMDTHTLIEQVSAALNLSKHTHQTRQILIKGDQQVDYGSVVQLMALLQQAGAANIGLITDPTDTNPARIKSKPP